MNQIKFIRKFALGFLALPLFLMVQNCIFEAESSEDNNPQIVDEKGKPVSAAKVYVTPVDNVPFRGSGSETELLGSGSETTFNGSGSETIVTNKDGRYSLDGVEEGDYNIEAYKDGKVSFRGSVNIKKGHSHRGKDTLRTPGVLTGKIRLLEEDDVRTVFVFILGTVHLTVPDDKGVFRFPDLGRGKYKLRILTTLDDYEVWDSETLEIKTGKTLDLGEIYLPHKTELNMKTQDLVGKGTKLYEFSGPVYGVDYYEGHFFQVNLAGEFSQYNEKGNLINNWTIENNLNDLYRTHVLKVLGKDSVLIVDENYNFNLYDFKGELYSKFSLNLDFYNISFVNGRLLLSDIAAPKIYAYNLNGKLLETYDDRDPKGKEFGALWGTLYADRHIFVIDKFGAKSESFISKYDMDFNYITQSRLYFQNTEWIRHCATDKEIFVLGSETGYLLDSKLNVKAKVKLFDGLSLNTKAHTGCVLFDSNSLGVFDENGYLEVFEFE